MPHNLTITFRLTFDGFSEKTYTDAEWELSGKYLIIHHGRTEAIRYIHHDIIPLGSVKRFSYTNQAEDKSV